MSKQKQQTEEKEEVDPRIERITGLIVRSPKFSTMGGGRTKGDEGTVTTAMADTPATLTFTRVDEVVKFVLEHLEE